MKIGLVSAQSGCVGITTCEKKIDTEKLNREDAKKIESLIINSTFFKPNPNSNNSPFRVNPRHYTLTITDGEVSLTFKSYWQYLPEQLKPLISLLENTDGHGTYRSGSHDGRVTYVSGSFESHDGHDTYSPESYYEGIQSYYEGIQKVVEQKKEKKSSLPH